MDRTQSMGLDPGASAPNTSARPSGESANCGTFRVVFTAFEKTVFPGGKTEKLMESPDEEFSEVRVAKNRAVPSDTAATTQPAHRPMLRVRVTAVSERTGSLFSASSI